MNPEKITVVTLSWNLYKILLTFLILLPRLICGSSNVSSSDQLLDTQSILLSPLSSSSLSDSIIIKPKIPIQNTDENEPLQVTVDVSVIDIEKIDCLKMEMSVHLFLHQVWKNVNHVQFENSSLLSEKKKNINEDQDFQDDETKTPQNKRNITTDYVGIMWHPDTIVLNQRYHPSQAQISKPILKWHQYAVEKFERIFTIIKCEEMNFSLYPFDHQTCTIYFQSSLYNTDQLQYKWNTQKKRDTMRKLRLIVPSPFEFTQVVKKEFNDDPENPGSSMLIFEEDINSNSGNHDVQFSKLSYGIKIRRLWSSYIINFYFTMTIFVGTSLMSLWLVHPKISFIFNFMNVIFINIFLGIWNSQSDIPKLYYCTAMDAYSILCILFIILILILNVYILFYIKNDEDDTTNDEERQNQSFKSSDEQKYFLPKQDEFAIRKPVVLGGEGGGKYPHPFLRTIHGRSSSSTSASAPTSSTNLASQQSKHAQIHIDAYGNGNGSSNKRKRRSSSNWELIKAKLLDKIRRSGHTIFLTSFIIAFLLYWIILLSIYYAT